MIRYSVPASVVFALTMLMLPVGGVLSGSVSHVRPRAALISPSVGPSYFLRPCPRTKT